MPNSAETVSGSPESAVATQPEDQPNGSAPVQEDAEQPRKRGRKPSTVRKTRTVELTLTVTGTAEGEWQAELSQGGKRMVTSLPIPAAAVSRAAAELHEDISKAIEEVLDTARQQHKARLEALEAELASVRQALAELQD